MERVFYHGMGDRPDDIDVMINIIKSGGIKSLSMQESGERGLFNGQDYISVCAWDKDVSSNPFSLNSAFSGWIYGCAGFIINGDIEAIKCDFFNGDYDSKIDRVSQFKDEWHVKDIIPIREIVGIFLPLNNKIYMSENKEKIDELFRYAEEFGWFIFDSDFDLCKNVNKEYNLNGIKR